MGEDMRRVTQTLRIHKKQQKTTTTFKIEITAIREHGRFDM